MERQQLQISFDFMMRKKLDKDPYFITQKRIIAVTEKKPKTLETQEYQSPRDMFIYRFVV